jgi:hypothetical protein
MRDAHGAGPSCPSISPAQAGRGTRLGFEHGAPPRLRTSGYARALNPDARRGQTDQQISSALDLAGARNAAGRHAAASYTGQKTSLSQAKNEPAGAIVIKPQSRRLR